MDKTWIDLPRSSNEYRIGLQHFLNLAFSNSNDGMILCPCKKCKNGLCKTRSVVSEHLLWNGFLSGYTKWLLHGELFSNEVPSNKYDHMNASDNMEEMLHDAFFVHDEINDEETMPNIEEVERPCKEAEKFYKLMKDAEKELYPGCKKFSKLSFIIRLLQVKCLGNWSDSSFTLLLNLLRESFPEDVQLPNNYYETRKILKDLGLNYEKIDACKNDCMVYWGVNEYKTKCETCDEPRWTTPESTPDENDLPSKKSNKDQKVPVKRFWYFPLKPRLQRLFMNSKIAVLMKWHDEERTKDGIMRHPADSPAWQTFDYNNPEFARDSRNIRLGLATDGFNDIIYCLVGLIGYSRWIIFRTWTSRFHGDELSSSYIR